MRDNTFGGASYGTTWQQDTSWKADPRFASETSEAAASEQPKGPLILIYGDREPEPPPYLVAGMLPQTQTAILAGQFSAGKTFVAIDLALAVMLGLDFAGHKVDRTGAVIWLAAEGANEVDARLKAAAMHRTGEDHKGKLPFCRQAHQVPKLTDPSSFARLMEIVNEAKARFAELHPDVPLALVVVDTLNSAADFQDQSDGAEAMRVMNLGRRLSDATGALVLLIDHFGKLVETGVKGSSDKGNAADAILSVLADKDGVGNVSKRRMSVFKLRNGPTGEAVPFSLVQVPVPGFAISTCAIEWQDRSISERAVDEVKADWTGNGRVFKASMVEVMIGHGKEQRPFGFDTKPVKAAELQRVRQEFYARYPAETQDAKKKAFSRELKNATGKALIASREIGGVDWLWFTKDTDEIDARPSGTPGGQGTHP